MSNVLNKAGYRSAHSATVTVLRRQLLSVPHAREIVVATADKPMDTRKLIELSRPGDVLLAFMEPPSKLNAGPNAHCGIVGENGTIFTNGWNNGIWSNAQYDRFFHYYKEVRLIRFSE